MLPAKLINIINELNSYEWIKHLKHQSNIYIVGGSVRDAFLNKDIKDIDLIVEGLTFSQIQELLLSLGKVDIVGESFSIIKFKPFEKTFSKEPFDIAIPRIDRKVNSGHKGFDVITENVTVDEDLKRRDFTINSIAVCLNTNEIKDPFNGLIDLQNKIIRATDKNAFIEDALRILRGVQFAARFNFVIEQETLQLMKDNVSLIDEISGERIYEELLKIVLKKGNISLSFKLINEIGIDKILFGNSIDVFNVSDNLDIISFFYTLCDLAGVKPDEFLKRRLKIDATLEKNLKVLDNIFQTLYLFESDADITYFLFKSFEKAPDLLSVTIFDSQIEKVILNIKNKVIPSNFSDVLISGSDIMKLTGIKSGPKIGELKEIMIKHALLNNYNWKDKEQTIDFFKRNLI